MAEPAATALIAKVATSLVTRLVQQSFTGFVRSTPIRRAITKTADAFRDELEATALQLTEWVATEEFSGLIETYAAAPPDELEPLVNSFRQATGFYDEEDRAPALVERFIRNLNDELYKSVEGPAMLGRSLEDIQKSLETSPQQPAATVKVDESNPTPADEAELAAEVRVAASLIDQGKPVTALAILSQVRERPGFATRSAELRFRVTANIGKCERELDNLEAAARELRATLDILPEDPRALAAAGVASVLREDYPAAMDFARRSLELDSHNTSAATVFLMAGVKAERLDEVESLLLSHPWIADHSECAAALAVVRTTQGNPEEAIGVLETAILAAPNDPRLHGYLANKRAEVAQEYLQRERPLPWLIPNAVRASLRDAEQGFTRAIELSQGQEAIGLRRDALNSRAGVRLTLGRPQEAIEDCKRALALDPEDAVCLSNLGRIQMILGQPAEAADAFRRSYELEPGPATAIDLGGALSAAGRDAEAIQIAQESASSCENNRQRISLADIILESASRTGQRDLIQETMNELEASFADDFRAARVRAEQLLRDEATDEAIALLRYATERATGGDAQLARLALSEVLGNAGRSEEAAAAIEPLVEADADNPLLERYAVYTFNAGRLDQALDIARKARRGGPPIGVITEIESLVLEYTGDYEAAAELRVRLHETSKEPRHLIHAAHLYVWLRQLESARETVSKLTPEDLDESSLDLLEFAQLNYLLGHPDWLDLGYAALRADFSTPETQLAYLGLFMRCEKQEPSKLEDPPAVSRECAVHLEVRGEARVLVIREELKGDRIDEWEVSCEDPVAKKLLGKASGDTVLLKESQFEEIEARVKKVQTLFTRAFQKIFADFTTRFPDHPGLQQMQATNDGMAKLFTALDRREADLERVKNLYRSNPITIGAVGRMLGDSALNALGFLASSEDVTVAGGATQEELNQQQASLKDAKHLAMDLMGLATIRALGIENVVADSFDRIVMHPDALRDLVAELMDGPGAFGEERMSLFAKDGEYRRYEQSSEEAAAERASLEAAIGFIESNASLQPGYSVLALGREKSDTLRDACGQESIMSLYAAKDSGAPYFSPDTRLRRLGESLDVPGISPQALLEHLRAAGRLSEDEFHRCMIELISMDVAPLQVAPETLAWTLRQGEPIERAQVAFRCLQGARSSDGYAARLAADLIRALAIEPVVGAQDFLILDLIVSALSSGRNAQQILPLFLNQLREKLRLLPVQLDEIEGQVSLWMMSRRL